MNATANVPPGTVDTLNDTRGVQFLIHFDAKSTDSLYLAVIEPLRIWLSYAKPKTGDSPRQMKILAVEKDGDRGITLLLEAPGGSTHILHFRASGKMQTDQAEILDAYRLLCAIRW